MKLKDLYPHTKAHYFPVTGQLSVRTKNCLKNVLNDFCPDSPSPAAVSFYTKEQLLQMPNFGKKSLVETEAWLKCFGYTLSPDWDSFRHYRIVINAPTSES